MWSTVNRALNGIFDLWFWPLQSLSPTWQVCITALPVTVLALLVFKHASNQEGITTAKDKIQAYLLELRLYKDDLRVTFRAQGRMLGYSLIYMRHALVPMAVMILPIVLVLVQIESRFAFRSLNPEESAILTVVVDRGGPVSRLEATLSVPPGLSRETPALRIDESGEILWRIRGDRAGDYRVRIRVGGYPLEKRVVVGPGSAPPSPAAYRANDPMTLIFPMEPSLDGAGPVSTVLLSYPRARGTFAGLSSASWILFGVSLLLGYALRGAFSVTF